MNIITLRGSKWSFLLRVQDSHHIFRKCSMFRAKCLTTQFELAWENSRHFATPPLVSPRNDVLETSANFAVTLWISIIGNPGSPFVSRTAFSSSIFPVGIVPNRNFYPFNSIPLWYQFIIKVLRPFFGNWNWFLVIYLNGKRDYRRNLLVPSLVTICPNWPVRPWFII